MAITAAQVKELRERTGAGMMECKRALQDTGGDIDAAVEKMRKEGLAKADKKAGRTAAEGAIAIKVADDGKAAAMVEVNCETDFVGKGEEFQDFARQVAAAALAHNPATRDELLGADLGGRSVEEGRRALVAKVGENIDVRRFVRIEAGAGALADYVHGLRIGVVVAVEGGEAELGRDLALQVAASAPQFVSADDVDEGVKAREREILIAQAQDSGKPADIIEKMVGGRMRKFVDEITLEGQPFVKDPDMSVGQLLKKHNARVLRFARFEVGEGIEKAQENFAQEVMAQVQGSK